MLERAFSQEKIWVKYSHILRHAGFTICFRVTTGFNIKLGDLSYLVSLTITAIITLRFLFIVLWSGCLSARLTHDFTLREGIVDLVVCREVLGV